MKPFQFSKAIIDWHEQSGRKDLPWQIDSTPYRVWVSEIMLQQTQVTTVIGYYKKFITKFPTIEQLAEADLDEVLPFWAGLGYYSRVRNLHKAAEQIHALGAFPDTLETLQALPGIGRSTAGAILSLGFKQSAPILDGNVKRVFARYFGIKGWPGSTENMKLLWALSSDYVPKLQAATYNQALMDIGATICTRRNPACADCPIHMDCFTYTNDMIDVIPSSKPKRAKPTRNTVMVILLHGGKVGLSKRPAKGIWSGLWSFPELESTDELTIFLSQRGIKLSPSVEALPRFRHSFTHYHLDIQPVKVVLKDISEVTSHQDWFELDKHETLAVPAPVKKLLSEL